MSDGEWKKPFICKIGLHDWQAVPSNSDRLGGAIGSTRYAVEMECSRCSRRKVAPLSTGHERDGRIG